MLLGYITACLASKRVGPHSCLSTSCSEKEEELHAYSVNRVVFQPLSIGMPFIQNPESCINTQKHLLPNTRMFLLTG